MESLNDALVNLTGLSIQLRLPRGWLRDEAIAGRIPCLKIGRRLLFNLPAVEKSLSERAATERQEVSHA